MPADGPAEGWYHPEIREAPLSGVWRTALSGVLGAAAQPGVRIYQQGAEGVVFGVTGQVIDLMGNRIKMN